MTNLTTCMQGSVNNLTKIKNKKQEIENMKRRDTKGVEEIGLLCF